MCATGAASTTSWGTTRRRSQTMPGPWSWTPAACEGVSACQRGGQSCAARQECSQWGCGGEYNPSRRPTLQHALCTLCVWSGIGEGGAACGGSSGACRGRCVLCDDMSSLGSSQTCTGWPVPVTPLQVHSTGGTTKATLGSFKAERLMTAVLSHIALTGYKVHRWTPINRCAAARTLHR